VKGLRLRSRRRKSRVSPRTSLTLRVALVLAACLAAYHYSLTTLASAFSIDSPLAYVGLVPLIAGGLVLIKAINQGSEPDIHDRHVDYIVGLPLLAAALAIVIFLPLQQSTFFWLWRIDLLSPPFFVAGAVALVFGARALWRVRLPVLFLFLMWPLPYSIFLNTFTDRVTSFTTSVVSSLLGFIPVAQPVSGADGVFAITHDGATFQVSVASACSGINGLVGFLLIGAASVLVVRGPMILKAVWLAAGLVLIWAINVARILLLFAVGQLWGEGAAIDGVHPVAGLVAFNLGVVAMILLLPRFRLRVARPEVRRSMAGSSTVSLSGQLAVSRAALACALVLVAGALAGIANGQMDRYQLLAQDFGTPRLTDLSLSNAQVAGWSLGQVDTYPWVRQYFGPDASWTRYEYDWQAASPNASTFKSDQPVLMDVISTSNLTAFSTYGLEDCYRFHNYTVLDARSVDLGGGVVGQALAYHNPLTQTDWLAVYWQWPVLGGGGDRYERVVINMLNPDPSQLSAPPLSTNAATSAGLSLEGWLWGANSGGLGDAMTRARDFLIGFSQQVVAAAASQGQ